ncbi:MAG: DUF4091 domain-containing protein [Candidatus Hydrogenedentes bacterium]|nr:DUF4091 domain-containing protein [Candidatus Hydrogenedentota bacterium]
MRTLCAFAVTCAIAAAAAMGEDPAGRGSILFDASYGKLLPGSTAEVQLWWASSGWKVSADRPAPKAKSKAIEIRCAGNEWDAAQIVVRPSKPLKGFIAKSNTLTGPQGATLDASNIEVLRVRYVTIQRMTDKWSALAPWPDPLPPFKGPIDLNADPAEPNQPLWVRVHVPKGTPAGTYKGTVTLTAEGYSAEVPLRVVVYGFELPDRMTCQTAFGFGEGYVWGYQKISDPAQRREVLDKYWQSFRNHHISPYHPTPLVDLPVTWVKLGENEGADLPEADRKLLQANALTPKFDWPAWDAEMERVFMKYGFNSFRLGLPNIGGGQLQGFDEDTREHELAFNAYCRTMQEHLREKGWLDYAYVYWTDEPAQNDYAWVQKGFLKLKAAAPDITRMITEHVVPEMIDGPNLWCPDSWWYDHDKAEERRKEGDRFWWYVCTVPKAPFPGLFIDHPGTDLRAWLWQTWMYKIEGVLVWASNLWSTSPAYKDSFQNPYEDAMSWVSGNGTKPDNDKEPWGNGDGRFMYPPEAAADGTQAETILDGPVDSIRWEMLRDGIEDYEYMVILKKLLAERGAQLSASKREKFERLLVVPAEITSGLKVYTKDPAPIEKHRDRVAQAIEALTAN